MLTKQTENNGCTLVYVQANLSSQRLEKGFDGNVLSVRIRKREGYFISAIEEPSVTKPVHNSYLLGFFDYMLHFIDMIRNDEDTEIGLQPGDAFIPICK